MGPVWLPFGCPLKGLGWMHGFHAGACKFTSGSFFVAFCVCAQFCLHFSAALDWTPGVRPGACSSTSRKLFVGFRVWAPSGLQVFGALQEPAYLGLVRSYQFWGHTLVCILAEILDGHLASIQKLACSPAVSYASFVLVWAELAFL